MPKKRIKSPTETGSRRSRSLQYGPERPGGKGKGKVVTSGKALGYGPKPKPAPQSKPGNYAGTELRQAPGESLMEWDKRKAAELVKAARSQK